MNLTTIKINYLNLSAKVEVYIANSLRLLSLSDDVLSMVAEGKLSPGHARSLIGLQNATDIAKKIIQKKLSVRQAENLTRQFRDKKFKLVQKERCQYIRFTKKFRRKNWIKCIC